MSLKFFHDFTKATDDFFKPDEYNLGRKVKVTTKCGSTKFSGELNAAAPSGKFTASVNPSFGKFEITEDQKKGLKLKFEAPKFYKELDLKSTHTASNVETEFKYKPSGSFWCARFVSNYSPNVNSQRICKGKFGVALVDSQLNLSVGAEGEVVDQGAAGVLTKPNLKPSTYSMGFRYAPSKLDEYSLIYTPDSRVGSGSCFQLSALRQCSENCTIAARAEGKADLKKTDNPPVVALGGTWNTGSGVFQGYVNSKSAYGLSYKFDLNERAKCTLGYSCVKENEAAVGYKLELQ